MLDNGVKPEIEVFDLAMLYNAANLVRKGLVNARPHVQFVMGVPNALPVRRTIFDFLRSELVAVLPDATWVAAGIGRHQWEVNQWCLEAGGHCRTGLEDNLRIEPDRLAASNAELVRKIVEACASYGRRPATAAEARQILGLAASTESRERPDAMNPFAAIAVPHSARGRRALLPRIRLRTCESHDHSGDDRDVY